MSAARGAAGTRAWARRVVAAGRGDDAGPGHAGSTVRPLDLVQAVVVVVARSLPGVPVGGASVGEGPVACPTIGAELRALADEATVALADRLPAPPTGWGDPWLPGVVHEQAVSAERRSARGAWYTPEPVVRGILALATADGVAPEMVVDPTCGGGAFLLAALDRLVELGVDPAEAIGRVAATDIDPDAVIVSRWSVLLWAAARGLDPSGIGSSGGDRGPGDRAGPVPDITVGDALDGPPTRWPPTRLVVGNPPFASPLKSGVLPARAEAFREANRDLLGPYTDLAAIHLLAALRSVGPGSTVALVQPQSVLSGRDTAVLRRHCSGEAPLHALWATRRSVFDAGVRACAVVLRPGAAPPAAVALAAGPDVAPVAEARVAHTPSPVGGGAGDSTQWAGLAAQALGAPALPPSLTPASLAGPTAPGRLGDLATATAGFRDEYYGLVAACREWDGDPGTEPNRLVTVGAVDPLTTTWGRRPYRFGGRTWQRPVIDLAALEPRVRQWTEQRLVPKVVLATQSRVLEPVVDRAGRLVPATPLVAVASDPDDLFLVAAVLLAPPVVAWAWRRWFGAALAVDALKLAARQVLELPLPTDRPAWEEAASLVAEADSTATDPSADCARDTAAEVAAIMNRAYGAGEDVLAWWCRRVPG